MTRLVRGALVEYGTDFMGPIPNVVVFQFNPESLNRTIEIPPRPAGVATRETTQAGEVPVERISLTAHFSAADELGSNNPLARLFGVGTRLAALEKMTRPPAPDALGQLPDAAGQALQQAQGEGKPAQPIPRERYPRILFIWGPTRVLPVIIDSMSIVEQEYDYLLNPTRAEVSLGLSVITPGPCSTDPVAEGALRASSIAKDVQASANLTNIAGGLADTAGAITNLALDVAAPFVQLIRF